MWNKNKAESPRPDFYREDWVSLNGQWDFEFDDANRGIGEKWFTGHEYLSEIRVPFCYQSQSSGICDTSLHEVFWYHRDLTIPIGKKGKRVWLNFGAVDYECDVWINGCHSGGHRGGNTPFVMEITPFLLPEGHCSITVRCRDSYDISQPRGKQHWNELTDRCWYTQTSGIWQNCWLEFTQGIRIERCLITPDIDRQTAEINIKLSDSIKEGNINWILRYEGNKKKEGMITVKGKKCRFLISMEYEDPIDNRVHLWSPEHPNLYDLELVLTEENLFCDSVESYFGMRRIERRENRILLNHYPLYQKLVLDQGYWKESLMTPPSREALRKDLLLVKEMGFNGVRKHQKAEEPGFLYLADTMGLLVWGEMPSNYAYSEDGTMDLTLEYHEIILRDYNHPSIITWVPFNESWGIRDVLFDKKQQSFALSLYHMTKALDDTRLVSTNDGWEAVEGDLLGIHDYEGDSKKLYEKYKNYEELFAGTAVGKMIYSDGYHYLGEPVLLSEFGGIAFEDGNSQSWGYNDKAAGEEEFLERFKGLLDAVKKLNYLSGFCYTQLTDVEQETNGLLYADRTPKVDMKKIREIME